jgi:hypothetical protein
VRVGLLGAQVAKQARHERLLLLQVLRPPGWKAHDTPRNQFGAPPPQAGHPRRGAEPGRLSPPCP